MDIRAAFRAAFPFPIIGIDSDNGSESINWHLLRWCEQNKTTFTRSRSGNSNDGAHVEQKNWAVVRTVVGYHRYDTTAELLLLNKIWALQSLMTNYFGPQQKLIKKVRNGAKGDQEVRHRDHPPPASGPTRSRSSRGQKHPRRYLPRPEPGGHPAPDPGPDRAAPGDHHPQDRTAPQAVDNSSHQAGIG